MRLSFFLLFIAIGVTLANHTYAQSTVISVDARNKSIADILDMVEQQSDFIFIYDGKVVDTQRKVSVNANQKNIFEVLSQVFSGSDIAYTVINKKIILNKEQEVMELSQKQETSITGTVTDEDSEPMPGVNVLLKGSTIGVITDSNGKYSITVPGRDAVLLFSFMGYVMQELVVGSQSVIDVVLNEDVREIEEVVVVGYGTLSKERVSTAITTIKADKLENKPLSTASQALIGTASGIWLQQVSGAPGSVPNIRIRGNGSITSGNNPLYVVDGFPMTADYFNSISPNDIESIDILKDAASAAIYGSKAGNGVIIVTTKKGSAGKTRFTFNSLVGFDEISNKIEMLNAEQYAEMAIESLNNQGLAIPEWFTNRNLWAYTDWQDVIFRKGLTQNYQLRADGGTDKVRYNMSLGYLDQQGILKNSYMKRYNFKADVQAKLNKVIDVGFSFLGSYTETRHQTPVGTNTQTGVSGVIPVALTSPPIIPVWQDNGDYFIIFQDDDAKQAFNAALTNPLNKLDANKNYSKDFRPSVNAYVELKPVKGLKIRSSISDALTVGRTESYVEAFLAKGGTNTGNISTPDLTQITASRANTTFNSLYWSNTASYDISFHSHNLTALVGYDVSIQSTFNTSVSPRTDTNNPVAFTNTYIKNVEGSVLKNGSSGFNKYTFAGLFGRINYDYRGIYLLTVSLRRDQSSRFGPDNRSGVFPSFSAGWNVSNEDFWGLSNAISLLKVRASYGVTGNDQLSGNYPWLSTLGKEYYTFGTDENSSQIITYYPGGFSNRALNWEKNKQFDLGLDLGFLNNRISLMMDFYERNSNTIFSSSVPIINGKSSSVIQNIGTIRNRGFELMVNTRNFVREFQWNTNFNISFNKNKITELAAGQTQLANTTAGQWTNVIRNYLDRPMGDFYMYVVEGTFNNADDLSKYAKFGTQDIGDIRYKDSNKDGNITPDDMERVGNYQPDFYFGLENSFSYKNFDLSILLNGSYGGEIVFAMERAISLGRDKDNSTINALGRWKSESDPGNGTFHKAGTKNLGSNIQASTRYLYDASFLRIRNITLGYNFPSKWMNKYGVQNLRLYFVVQNLHTFTEYPGYNPEANDHGDNATRNGVDEGSYPLARNFSFGLNVTF